MSLSSAPEKIHRASREAKLTFGQKAQRLGALAILGLLTACSSGVPGNATVESTATPTATATITPSPAESPTVTSAAGGTIDRQEVEEFGVYAFDNYQNASGEEQFLPIGTAVIGRCLIYDPNTSVTTTKGLWYRLDTPQGPNHETVYVAANTFWNQVPPQPPDEHHPYDQQLALCPDSPSQVPPTP